MAAINPTPYHIYLPSEEIEANILQMQKMAEEGKEGDIDVEFINIFSSAISHLETGEKKALQTTLSELSSSIIAKNITVLEDKVLGKKVGRKRMQNTTDSPSVIGNILSIRSCSRALWVLSSAQEKNQLGKKLQPLATNILKQATIQDTDNEYLSTLSETVSYLPWTKTKSTLEKKLLEITQKPSEPENGAVISPADNDPEEAGFPALSPITERRVTRSRTRAVREGSAAPSPHSPPSSIPLIGSPQLTTELANQKQGITKKGLEFIACRFPYYIPVKGDGHCLFRAVGYALFRFFAKDLNYYQARAFKEVIVENIASWINAMESSRHLSKQYKLFITYLTQVLERKKTAEEIFLDQKKSDEIVQFLRLLSCEYNGKDATGKEFISIVSSADEISPKDYLTTMASMKKPASSNDNYGGEPELQALSKALGICLEVFDTDLIGRNLTTPPTIHGDLPARLTISLLFRPGPPGHYDIAHKGSPAAL